MEEGLSRKGAEWECAKRDSATRDRASPEMAGGTAAKRESGKVAEGK